MMNLADQLAADSVEDTSKPIVTTRNDKIPGWQRPCLENAICIYGVSERLNLFHAQKLVFVDAIFEIRNE